MAQLPIMSVSGIRGKMNETISPSLFATIAYLQTTQAGGGRILVGRDTRDSGARLAGAVFRGIRCAGGVPVDLGIAPTPTVCFATAHYRAAGGIIITASHNPLPYNGYKMVHAEGRLFSAEECDAVYHRFHKGERLSEEQFNGAPEIPAMTLDAVTPHCDAIIAAIDAETIRNAAMTIAVDSINGAAGVIFPRLCDALGVRWLGVHNKLDGDFVHNPEPRPEYLGDLASLLRAHEGLRGGFAFDPDADRLALMGEHGEPLSEEMTLALALENILRRKKSTVVVNLSTTMLIDAIAREHGVSVIRTKIGEANVVAGMKQHHASVGGEGNGGVIYPKISTVRDGPAALALILELMAKTGKTLTSLVSGWPVYPIIKEKITLGDTPAAEVMARLAGTFSSEHVDTRDGLKILRGYGWVHVRPSNTEPILRCYAEAETEAQARELADLIIRQI